MPNQHPQPVLRRMRWWDIEQIDPLEHALFGAHAWPIDSWWGEVAAPDRWYVVAQNADGEILGYAGLSGGARPGDTCDVQTIAVAPAAQGSGLGRTLLQAMLAEAGNRQAAWVMLEVRADNPVAIGLYHSQGFEQISRRRRYYQPGNVDALIMRTRPTTPVTTPPAHRTMTVSHPTSTARTEL